MSVPVHGCPTCQTAIGADGCPRHNERNYPIGGNLPLYRPDYVAGLKAENEQMKEALDKWLHSHDHYLAGRFPRRCVACARLADFVSSLNGGKANA